ncbi:Ldh family oxidoreductase [Amycolatopsis jejuensis]|uniref:Ldh family oxidoreductase n=1 Tax=Amycolatopsis jejuensis TaxID=330084 RepID=UPI0005270021|nr:Ldh family oxidoreductase [Amycolatopsis jejuensis]
MTELIEVGAGEAQQRATGILVALGAPHAVAEKVAAHLVEADQVGHASHGLARLPWYSRYVRDGVVCPSAVPRRVSEGDVVTVSADWGFSHAAAYLATELAVERALDRGTSAASVIRCTHVGRLGAYVELAAASGCVAIATIGGMRGPGVAVPFGGSRPLLGPSPIAAAFPTTGPPVVMDFATTEVPLGKVMVAKNAGTRLAVPGLVEPDGRPTDDPAALERGGALRTFGAHKGFALATMAELLGGILTGAGDHRDDGPGGPSFRGAGLFLFVVSAAAFGSAETVRTRASELREAVHAVPPADGFDTVLAPGDPESRNRAAAGDYVRLPADVWREIQELPYSTGRDRGEQ